jgi:proteic killer suppression protein
MIKGFRHKGLKRFYQRGDPRGILSDQVRKIGILLAALDDAGSLEDLNRPSFRLHPSTGDRKGQWAFK